MMKKLVLKMGSKVALPFYCASFFCVAGGAFAADRQYAQAAKNPARSATLSVIPLEEGMTAVKRTLFNANGSESERMTCVTNNDLDPNMITDVMARVVTPKGHFEYIGHYNDERVRDSAQILTFPKGHRFADKTLSFPDDKRTGPFQIEEGATSLVLFDTCKAIVAKTQKLEANPMAHDMRVRPMHPDLKAHVYKITKDGKDQTAREAFLNGGSRYGYFLKELGLK